VGRLLNAGTLRWGSPPHPRAGGTAACRSQLRGRTGAHHRHGPGADP